MIPMTTIRKTPHERIRAWQSTYEQYRELWGNFKRAIIGVYRVVSPQHLQFYVNEFIFRRNTCKFATDDRFLYFMENVQGYQLRYKELIEYARCS